MSLNTYIETNISTPYGFALISLRSQTPNLCMLKQ